MGVRFEHVSKRYGDVEALRDFSLDIADGEFLVLLGPSGCGKTTALRILAGLEEATSGEIYIDDQRVTDLAPRQRDIAMVFQNYALYPHMRVYDNIAFGLRMRKVSRSELDQRVRETAETLGLTDFLNRRPGQLSGGQRQRVALARAIVRNPKAFLMDEPLSNLDAQLRSQTRIELIHLHRRLQTTAVYVTHDQVEAMTMGHRVAILNQGVLQQVGEPQETYDRPANTFVAAFIGTPPMPLFEGDVRASDGRVSIDAAGTVFQPAERDVALLQRSNASRVIVGARPEHIELSETYGERPAAAAFDASIDVVESLGSEIHVTALLDDRTVPVRLPPETPIKPGEMRRFVIPPERLHLFDAASGARLQ
jgi:multiple sugar transport system ATP-binding protein